MTRTQVPGRQPQDAASTFRDIEVALARGDNKAATALACKALDAGLAHPMLFDLRAFWHESEGRYPAACADLQSALVLAPGNALLLNLLGRCRTANGELIEGIAACRAAIAADPSYAAAHYNEGFALERLAELDEAWRSYNRALQLAPSMADASARLAGLAARRGDNSAARDLANRALNLQPGNVPASSALILVDLAERNFAAAEIRARAVASNPLATSQERSTAFSYIADALDGLGRTADAFDLYRRANEDLAREFKSRFAGVERGQTLVRRLSKEIAAIEPSRWRSTSEKGAKLIFLMGFPRSGTTLLGQILAAHSYIETIEEKPLLGEALREFINTPGGLEQLASLPSSELARHREIFWDRVANEIGPKTGKFVVDQTPLNTLHLPVIARLFPESKVIFAVRDPRDVVLSCFRRLFSLNPYTIEFLSLDDAACFYDETMRLADRYREAIDLAVTEVRNEDLIADFEGQTRSVCDFIGLSYDPKMASFSESARDRRISTPSSIQLGRGITKAGIGHWRHYEKQMATVLPIIAPWVERFGYA